MANTRIDFQSFHWLDVINPTSEQLNELAKEYELHPTSVQDCLQPEHLPKYEMINDVSFVVLRTFDRDCSAEADSVQELTRKISIFYGDRFVLTLHRSEPPFMSAMIEKWRKKSEKDPSLTPEHILADVITESVRSFERPVLDGVANLELLEQEIFGAGTHRKFRMQKGYYLKRKISVYKRMLRATHEPLNRVMQNAEAALMPHFQNAREMIDNLYFTADDVSENLASLLNLHISLQSQKTNEASHRTNEVMRVLTIFSCFFLPINFIASIYGMNFKYMPELEFHYGYYCALSLMLTVAVGIFIWFRRKGWLGKGQL